MTPETPEQLLAGYDEMKARRIAYQQAWLEELRRTRPTEKELCDQKWARRRVRAK